MLQKKPIKIRDVNVDNIVISILIETKNFSKYFIGFKSDKAIRPSVLIIPKISGCVKPFKGKESDNKLISLCIDDEKLLEKYKAIWNKIEDFKNIELNALSVYVSRCIQTKRRTYGDKVYANLYGVNVPEDDMECEFFRIISIDS